MVPPAAHVPTVETSSTVPPIGLARLTNQVPVFIFYWTAFAGGDGQMNFRSDPYNWDRELLQRVGVLAAGTKV